MCDSNKEQMALKLRKSGEKVSDVVFPFFSFFTLSFIFTSFREQYEAYINSLRWSALVGLEPACKSPTLPLCYGRRQGFPCIYM